MRKLMLVLCCVVVLASLAVAKDKIMSQWTCSQPSEMHAIPVPDMANHSYAVSKAACTAVKSSLHEKDAMATQFDEATGGSTRWHGIFVTTADNGDHMHYSYASKGAVLLKDGKFETGIDTWSITGGTGKFSGAKGEGTCTGKGNADGTATWDCEGTYSMTK